MQEETKQDYRVTFGIAASSFTASMVVRKNSLDLSQEYPLASKAALEPFYVDYGLTGANNVQGAIQLRDQLQELFARACLHLRKWNSSEIQVLEAIPHEL